MFQALNILEIALPSDAARRAFVYPHTSLLYVHTQGRPRRFNLAVNTIMAPASERVGEEAISQPTDRARIEWMKFQPVSVMQNSTGKSSYWMGQYVIEFALPWTCIVCRRLHVLKKKAWTWTMSSRLLRMFRQKRSPHFSLSKYADKNNCLRACCT